MSYAMDLSEYVDGLSISSDESSKREDIISSNKSTHREVIHILDPPNIRKYHNRNTIIKRQIDEAYEYLTNCNTLSFNSYVGNLFKNNKKKLVDQLRDDIEYLTEEFKYLEQIVGANPVEIRIGTDVQQQLEFCDKEVKRYKEILEHWENRKRYFQVFDRLAILQYLKDYGKKL